MLVSIRDRQLATCLAELDRLTDWERRPRSSMRVGLEPMLDLVQRLGNPHEGFRVIHVTGTKGKSSTSALIEAGLVRAGFNVGRYGSPHVVHVRERISLNGAPVCEDELASALERSLAALRDAKRAGTAAQDATWFDVLTASSFCVFKRAGLDFAVVEVGLGGRLDSTNVVQSEIALITNVELEHTEVLGGTRTAIAFEKSGIIKNGSVVVTALAENDEAGRVVQQRADELGCELLRPAALQAGGIMEGNAALAGLALDTLARSSRGLGASLLDAKTIAAARLPGRLETFRITIGVDQTPVPVVLDGAHVPFSLAAVMADLTQTPDFAGPCCAVVSIAKDKDALGLLSVLSRYPVSITFTKVNARSRSPRELLALAQTLDIKSTAEDDPWRAYEVTLRRAAVDGAWILVTGSLYLVGAIAGNGANSCDTAARRRFA